MKHMLFRKKERNSSYSHSRFDSTCFNQLGLTCWYPVFWNNNFNSAIVSWVHRCVEALFPNPLEPPGCGMNLPGLPLLAWIILDGYDGCLFGSIFCQWNLGSPGFKHLHRPFYQADSLQLVSPGHGWFVSVYGLSMDAMIWVLWKAWQSRVLVVKKMAA